MASSKDIVFAPMHAFMTSVQACISIGRYLSEDGSIFWMPITMFKYFNRVSMERINAEDMADERVSRMEAYELREYLPDESRSQYS
jgi:hypothetical protein